MPQQMDRAVARLAYLTVITWPPEVDVDEFADVVADACGIDSPTMRMRARQAPPVILGAFEASTADLAVKAVLSAGGDAFAPRLGEIEALGATLKIKEMHLEAEGVGISLWRGPSLVIDPADIQILIRARLSKSRTMPAVSALSASAILSRHVWVAGGAYGLAVTMHSGGDYALGNNAIHELKISEKLDIHVADGRVFQVDGDKFGFKILGAERGLSDNVNIDRMCDLMARLEPNAVVDPYFSYWRPPPEHHRFRIPNLRINQDDVAFAFYSRWAALMYRHVMGLLQ